MVDLSREMADLKTRSQEDRHKLFIMLTSSRDEVSASQAAASEQAFKLATAEQRIEDLELELELCGLPNQD